MAEHAQGFGHNKMIDAGKRCLRYVLCCCSFFLLAGASGSDGGPDLKKVIYSSSIIAFVCFCLAADSPTTFSRRCSHMFRLCWWSSLISGALVRPRRISGHIWKFGCNCFLLMAVHLCSHSFYIGMFALVFSAARAQAESINFDGPFHSIVDSSDGFLAQVLAGVLATFVFIWQFWLWTTGFVWLLLSTVVASLARYIHGITVTLFSAILQDACTVVLPLIVSSEHFVFNAVSVMDPALLFASGIVFSHILLYMWNHCHTMMLWALWLCFHGFWARVFLMASLHSNAVPSGVTIGSVVFWCFFCRQCLGVRYDSMTSVKAAVCVWAISIYIMISECVPATSDAQAAFDVVTCLRTMGQRMCRLGGICMVHAVVFVKTVVSQLIARNFRATATLHDLPTSTSDNADYEFTPNPLYGLATAAVMICHCVATFWPYSRTKAWKALISIGALGALSGLIMWNEPFFRSFRGSPVLRDHLFTPVPGHGLGHVTGLDFLGLGLSLLCVKSFWQAITSSFQPRRSEPVPNGWQSCARNASTAVCCHCCLTYPFIFSMIVARSNWVLNLLWEQAGVILCAATLSAIMYMQCQFPWKNLFSHKTHAMFCLCHVTCKLVTVTVCVKNFTQMPSVANLLIIGMGVDATDMLTLIASRLLRLVQDFHSQQRKIFKCRKVGRRRYPLNRRCMRRPRYTWISSVWHCFSFLWQKQLTSYSEKPDVQNDLPFCSSYRGGGRKGGHETPEQKLLQGLKSLLQDAVPSSSSSAKGKGKGPGKGKSVGKNQPAKPKNDPPDNSYGLVQALQKLTTRAAKRPQGLLQRLKTLVEVTERGMLRPSKKKPHESSQAATQDRKQDRRNHKAVKSVERAVQPTTRWQRDKSWKARAQDWGVSAILRGPSSLCSALDNEDEGSLLCQVKDLDDWNEALQIAHSVSRKNITIVFEHAPGISPEVGSLRFHGWTVVKTLAAGYADNKLVQRQVWVARCSPSAPSSVPGSVVHSAKRPVVTKPCQEESFVFRISCDMRFIAADNRKHITQGPGKFFRMWLSDLGPGAKELLLHLGDTWGFQKIEEENLVRGFARIKGKDRALQLLRASGAEHKGHASLVFGSYPLGWPHGNSSANALGRQTRTGSSNCFCSSSCS